MIIPKTIYRTWVNATLPDPFQLAWNFTKHHNPTFSQHLFTDADINEFMHRYYRNHTELKNDAFTTFYSINPVYGTARADFFRYLLLFEFGGIYLDVKSAARNISRVIRHKDEFVTSHWPLHSVVRLWSSLHLKRINGEYQQWWLASTPRHPTMLTIIRKIISNIQMHTEGDHMIACDTFRRWVGDSLVLYLVPGCKGVDILWTTGPFAYTKAIEGAIADDRIAKRTRFLWPDGDSTFIYDYTGMHRKYGRLYWTRGADLIVNTSRRRRYHDSRDAAWRNK